MMKKVLMFCVLFYALGTQIVVSQELYTKQETVSTIPLLYTVREGVKAMELKWGITETTWNQHELFISIHGGREFGQPHVAAIYLRIGDKYKLLRKINSAGYFSRPHAFWITPDKSKDKEHFIHINETQYGTGHFNTEHVFSILITGELEDIEFVDAAKDFADQLKPGEGVWKGTGNSFTADGLSFTFYIWNKDDANAAPTAGKVIGTYKITAIDKKKRKYKISANDYKRLPVEIRK